MISGIKKIKSNIRKFIPSKIINFYHYFLTFVGAVRYKFPGKKLIVIGITGTKGKTTVCYLTHFLLQKLGIKTSLSSSEFFLFGEESIQNKSRTTTPGKWFLQKFLKESINKNCEVAIIEITSEGLMQNRHCFIDFDIAVFINIHPEHIEHHGGYEKYKLSKSKLFQNLLNGKNKYFRGKIIKKTIIANLDDKESDYFLNFPAHQKITYSIDIDTGNSTTNIRPDKFQTNTKGVMFNIDNLTFDSKLIGVQNIQNILASFSIINALEIAISGLKQPLSEFEGLSGRFEIIPSRKCKIIIDYAHTPNSIEALFKNIWEIFKPKKLLCLVGAAGGHRDKWKRPVIGEIAAKYCNKIIISDEDPFDEDPRAIMRSIEQGVKKYFELYDFKKDYEIIEDRKEAITNLIESADKSDIVVLIGKGSEKTIETNFGSIPWNEKEVVFEILNGMKKHVKQSSPESSNIEIIPKSEKEQIKLKPADIISNLFKDEQIASEKIIKKANVKSQSKSQSRKSKTKITKKNLIAKKSVQPKSKIKSINKRVKSIS